MMRLVVAVAVGGAAGSVLRFLISHWAAAQWPRHVYLGTLAINLLGCLLIGLFGGLFLTRSELPTELRLGLTTGLLGGFTTFSTFSLEAFKLLEGGRVGEALGYLLFSVVGGLLAAWGGLLLARLAS
jgi:CrcB protein